MLSFKEFITEVFDNPINEGKVHQVTVFSSEPSFKVFQNPDKPQMKTLHASLRDGEMGSVRSLKHQGDHYVWDGYNGTHYHVARRLGISDGNRGEYDATEIPKANFDAVRLHKESQVFQSDWKNGSLNEAVEQDEIHREPSSSTMKTLARKSISNQARVLWKAGKLIAAGDAHQYVHQDLVDPTDKEFSNKGYPPHIRGMVTHKNGRFKVYGDEYTPGKDTYTPGTWKNVKREHPYIKQMEGLGFSYDVENQHQNHEFDRMLGRLRNNR